MTVQLKGKQDQPYEICCKVCNKTLLFDYNDIRHRVAANGGAYKCIICPNCDSLVLVRGEYANRTI